MKPTLREILDATLVELDMPYERYKRVKGSRLMKVVEVRQIVCYVGVHYGYRQYEIADFLNIDISSVHHHKKNSEGYCSYDKSFANKVYSVMSHFEKVRFYHRENGYIARDKEDFTLTFFREKPIESDGVWTSDKYSYSLPKDYFPQVSYGDSPISCELTLRLR